MEGRYFGVGGVGGGDGRLEWVVVDSGDAGEEEE